MNEDELGIVLGKLSELLVEVRPEIYDILRSKHPFFDKSVEPCVSDSV